VVCTSGYVAITKLQTSEREWQPIFVLSKAMVINIFQNIHIRNMKSICVVFFFWQNTSTVQILWILQIYCNIKYSWKVHLLKTMMLSKYKYLWLKGVLFLIATDHTSLQDMNICRTIEGHCPFVAVIDDDALSKH